jgi:hypothetical protein
MTHWSVPRLAPRFRSIAGNATLTTEASMKPRLEPRIVAGKTKRVLGASPPFAA